MRLFSLIKERGTTASARRERYGLLLLSIIAAFAVQGIANDGHYEQVIVSALLATTLLLALWAANARPRVIWVAAVVGGAVLVASVAEAASGSVNGAAYRLSNLLLVTLAPPVIVIGIVRNIRTRSQVTIEAVFGVLCVYLLLGMFFAFVYGVIGRYEGSFFAQNVPASVAHCLYFSFITLTTVGYGDLTASSNLGHTLSAFEALIGQIYLVTIVSLFVGNLRRNVPSRPPAADP
jgi:ABC-type multidrug transport system fused ATPase/permease subunit